MERLGFNKERVGTSGLDLTIKENWTTRNLREIAEQLGYFPNRRFKKAFRKFYRKIIGKAKIGMYLELLFDNLARNFNPSLIRLTPQMLKRLDQKNNSAVFSPCQNRK